MEEKELENWRKAGKIGAEVLEYAKGIVKPNMLLLEIAEKVEAKIKELGATSAFPINLSINEIAAHSSPVYDDSETVQGLLKIDIGVSVDGYISDNAVSVDLSPDKKYKKLILASEEALNNAIKIIKPGITLGEIGRVIQKTIDSHGFTPILNLTGHEMKRWELHSGMTVPNYDDKDDTTKLEEGMIIAIEPFATNGQGIVQDGRASSIYRFLIKHNTRDSESRKLLDFIEKEYKTLPFSGRWLVKQFGSRALFSLRMLEQVNSLHHFKQLVEKTKAPVSQAEHTVLVTKQGCEVLTKSE